jgi:hypothetical protein
MTLATEQYELQAGRWPQTGRHILAQFDQDSIVVYQAYRPAIAESAVANRRFGGDFSYSRMSWIKPNFLWMMYRCGWATKEGQERVLAVRIRRDGVDQILAEAVHSTYCAELYGTAEAWKKAVGSSNVRLQWDPDHDPHGEPLKRRAIQLGLQGPILKSYGGDWIVSIEDITGFVRQEHAKLASDGLDGLKTPLELPYPVADPRICERLGLDVTNPFKE